MSKKNRIKRRNKLKKSRYWLLSATATGVLFAYSVGSSRAINLKYIKSNNTKNVGTLNYYKAKPALKPFDIPAGTLEEVIAAFEKISGWRVIIPDDVKSVGSQGVSGDYTNQQALKIILEETGVTYNFSGPKTIQLKLQGPSETVDVVDVGSPLASPKYTEPLRYIPQTITVIDKETIEEQGATTLRDALKNVPGLTLSAGEGGNPAGDNLILRGFSARNDIYVDGVRDLSPQSRETFNVEQVEVVKGPSSSTTGRGSTGGTINLVSKTPKFSPAYDFSLSLGNDKTKRATGDINTPLSESGFGNRSAVRLNAMYHDSAYAGRKDVKNNRWGIAPSLSFGIGSNTDAILSYSHLNQDNVSDYGIPWVPSSHNVLVSHRDRPAPVPRSTFYGFVNRDHEILKSHFGTATVYHTFNDNVTLRNQLRYGMSERDSIVTPPRFTRDGNSTVIRRPMIAWLTDDRTWDNQTDFTLRFNTGSFRHSLVTGMAFTREKNDRIYRSSESNNFTTTLLNPNPHDRYTGTITTRPLTAELIGNTQSFYLFDSVDLHPNFKLTGGFRFDRFDVDGNRVGWIRLPSGWQRMNVPISKTDNMFSYRIGAVYKPKQNGSFYIAYSTSLNPSLEGLTYRPAHENIDPEKTYTLEAGTKWDLYRNRIFLSGSLFSVNKTNARTDGLLPSNTWPRPQVLEGEQRVRGIELAATGLLTRDWSILAGYTLLDSRVIKSNDPEDVGARLPQTPRNSLNLWTTYRLLFRLTIGGGARFTDKRFTWVPNRRFADGYWLIDAIASYQVNENIDFRININNIADEYYFDRVYGGHVIPGPARSVLFTTSFSF